MCSRREELGLLFYPTNFFVASVGFSLSLLATIFAFFIPSSHSGPPIIEIRKAAVTASAHSSPKHSSPKSIRNRAASPSPAPTRPERPEKLQVHVEPTAAPEVEVTLSPLEMSPVAALTPHAVHFESPKPMSPLPPPMISISAPPTRLAFHVPHGSQTSTDSNTNTFSSGSTDLPSIDSSPDTERRGRRRLRFSKLVHLFDKRGKVSRRLSLSELQSDEPPLSPTLSPIASSTLSPIASPTLLPPVTSPTLPPSSPPTSPVRSPSKKKRPHALMLRVASCPILHDMSAETVQSPCTKKAAEKKAPVVRPRTHPYEAPYFIPPPDSVDVVEPIARRRPSRRRTMPPPERRVSVA
ncbi:hypothetical protein C8R44DRAFT_864160 [Mycena epipterygia]|nr:hypothetical protein C8R44DRAFT_864160 [Mycena epipterygia]